MRVDRLLTVCYRQKTSGMLVRFLVVVLFMVLCQVAAASEKMQATGSLEVAFSPAHNPEALIIRVIDEATRSIHVQAYVFTSRAIANALIAAHRRGVRVEVLADAEMNKRGGRNAAMPALLNAGVPVAFETDYAAAHNKVLIVDAGQKSCTLVTGSYNFTWSAQNRNAENIVVFRQNCRLVDSYFRNWQRHRQKATIVTSLPWRR